MIKFVVLNISPLSRDTTNNTSDSKYMLAEAEIAKEDDLGSNDRTYNIITHMGNIITTGNESSSIFN